MGLRFRKTFKLAPGVRMTVGSGGTSFNFGPRGASVSVGKRGVYANASVFGFASRSKLSGPAPRPKRLAAPAPRATAQPIKLDVTVGVTDQGELYFKDAAGNPLPEAWVQAAKKQQGDALRRLIQTKCDEINAQIEAIGELHRDTPSPQTRPVYTPRDYLQVQPAPPQVHRIDVWARVFASRRRRIETENAELLREHEADVDEWSRGLAAHRQAEAARRKRVEEEIYADVDAMERFLEETLQDVAWPRETLISVEIREAGRLVCLDVDLPEIEDMPATTAAVPARGLKLSVKDMPPTHRQRLYMKHIHAVGFRIIGESFAALPVARRIVVSAYSQRRDKATGHEQDEYLYSARVERDAWTAIDFSQEGLRSLDVVEALSRFDLRRAMSKTGVFKPIVPFAADREAHE